MKRAAMGSGRVSILLLALGMATASRLWAQPVMVYSEFAEIDQKGNVTSPAEPREILSPAVPRNGFGSFQVAVQVPEGKEFQLHMGLNPANAIKVSMYRRGDNGTLEPVQLPYKGKSTQVFWMDLWAEKTDPVRRIKVEPQILLDDDWVIYPMEVRVRELIIPDEGPAAASLRAYLCNPRQAEKKAGLAQDGMLMNIARLRLRNEMQDVSLAAQATDADREELRKRMGGCNSKPAANPEAYLELRDYFFKPPWLRFTK